MAKDKAYKYIDPEAVAKLGRFNIVARSVVEGAMSGLHRSPYHGFSVEFAEHREYAFGDNLRDIDWKVLGKTDRYYIKQYEEETNLKAYVVLDTSASMGYSSNGLTKLEYGSYIAASLMYMMVKQQDSVGLITFDDKINTFVPAGGTTLHLNMLLQKLEELQPGQQTNVGKAFHDLAEYIKRRGLIIIISDLYDDRKEVMKGLAHFRHKRHEVMLFHVLDKGELEFPFTALSDFIDMETKEKIQVDPKYVRDEYLRQIGEFLEAYKSDCSASAIEYVVTDTSVPYDLVLTAYLGKRKRIG